MTSDKSKRRLILITGCSDGGIGSAIAQQYAKLSPQNHIIATVRNTTKASELEAYDNITVTSLDVTSSSSIASCVATLHAHPSYSPTQGLDTLYNNAGGGIPAYPLLEAPIDSVRRMFEANVFGLLAVTQAFAPDLRVAKGTIVNISSLGGMLNTPWIGGYSASKAAVTMLSETLRVEVAPFGVRVVTAVVGMVESRFHDNMGAGKERMIVLDDESPYKGIEGLLNQQSRPRTGRMKKDEMKLEVFTELLVKDVEMGKKGMVYRGTHSTLMPILKALLPTRALDFLLGRAVGMDQLWDSVRV